MSSWAEWSARAYGPGWEESKRRYRVSRLRRRRCLWCFTTRRLEMNHLTYAFSRVHRIYGSGWVGLPWRWFVLVPMCRRCHRVETWVTRNLTRPFSRPLAHVLASYLPWLALRLAVLLALLVALPGCSAAQASVSLLPYELHVPPAPRPAAGWPLVVNLHGADWTGTKHEEQTGMDEVADAAGFLVAYPTSPDGRWDAGRCCLRPGTPHRDDVSAVVSVVLDVEQRETVDRSRVYVVGGSNGGMMAWRAACDRPDVFAGAGVVAGSLVNPCPDTPVKVARWHGALDTTVPYYGGRGFQGTYFPSPTWGLPILCPQCETVTMIDTEAGHTWTSQVSGWVWSKMSQWTVTEERWTPGT